MSLHSLAQTGREREDAHTDTERVQATTTFTVILKKKVCLGRKPGLDLNP